MKLNGSDFFGILLSFCAMVNAFILGAAYSGSIGVGIWATFTVACTILGTYSAVIGYIERVILKDKKVS